MHPLRLLLAVPLSLAVLAPVAVPGLAATTPTVSGTATATGGWTEGQPTQAELDAQRAKVAELGKQADAASGAVDDVRSKLEKAARQAGLALETYGATVRRLQTAQVAEQQQQEALQQVDAELAANRQAVGRWARDAYQGGSLLTEHPALNALLDAAEPGDVSTAMTVFERVGSRRSKALLRVAAARTRQAAITESAADAAQRASDAAIDATDARKAADAARQAQRTALAAAQDAQAGAQTELDAARDRQTAMTAAGLLDGVGSGVGSGSGSGADKDNRITGQVGSCAGGDDVQQYPNGQIPVAALCALWQAPRHHLRADAAYAFDQLSKAYAAAFGRPICITDSYRSLAAQISVYARKPGLAAVPGTSNHGWGTATDLCGGIQSFTSAQHSWMLLHAPLYGWFHPSWAEPGGSRPEPWHWEYGG